MQIRPLRFRTEVLPPTCSTAIFAQKAATFAIEGQPLHLTVQARRPNRNGITLFLLTVVLKLF
jgi:hypothetical protein